MNINITLAEGALAPSYAHATDAGADLYANAAVTIPPKEYRVVPTGVFLELPEDCEAQVRSRSGLAYKHGIAVLQGIGTIDAGYRGEIRVMLINHGNEPFGIAPGDRIAQLVVNRFVSARFVTADALSETERGAGGFGSTGV